MPLAMKKRCGIRGCSRTTRGRYCDEHKPLAQRRLDQRRGLPRERGYDSAWRQVAAARRQRDAFLCQDCLQHEQLVPSKLVDHIIPIHVRPDWRLEIDNTQVLCETCHGRKTGEDLKRYGGRGRKELTSEQRRNRIAAQRLASPARAEPSESEHARIQETPEQVGKRQRRVIMTDSNEACSQLSAPV